MAGDLQRHTLRPAQPHGRRVERCPGTCAAGGHGGTAAGSKGSAQAWHRGVFAARTRSPQERFPPPDTHSPVDCVFQKQQLIARYLELGGKLTGPLLQKIGGRCLCSLSEEQIKKVTPEAIG